MTPRTPPSRSLVPPFPLSVVAVASPVLCRPLTVPLLSFLFASFSFSSLLSSSSSSISTFCRVPLPPSPFLRCFFFSLARVFLCARRARSKVSRFARIGFDSASRTWRRFSSGRSIADSQCYVSCSLFCSCSLSLSLTPSHKRELYTYTYTRDGGSSHGVAFPCACAILFLAFMSYRCAVSRAVSCQPP